MRIVAERLTRPLYVVAIAIATAAATATAAAAAPVHAELDVRLTLASSYTHRGIDYAASGPSWQGALEYRAGGGFAGLWAAGIDVDGYADTHGRDLELDYYLGYGRRLGSDVAVEAMLIRYTFHGHSSRRDDWTELQLTAYLGSRWTLTTGVAENWWGAGATTRFVEGTWRYPLPARLMLDVTAGYQRAASAVGFDYGYAETGLSIGLRNIVLRLGRTLVESDARQRFAPLADDHWVASVTLVR